MVKQKITWVIGHVGGWGAGNITMNGKVSVAPASGGKLSGCSEWVIVPVVQ